MPKNFKFHNHALGRTVSSQGSRFENFAQALVEATDDIRNLEKWLQSCNIYISVFCPIKKEDVLGIEWDKRGDTWRLLAVLEDKEAILTGCSTKPLIDSNARTRLICHPHLARLIEDLADFIPNTIDPLEPFGMPTSDDFTDAEGK